jgi:hypothetical protein
MVHVRGNWHALVNSNEILGSIKCGTFLNSRVNILEDVFLFDAVC